MASVKRIGNERAVAVAAVNVFVVQHCYSCIRPEAHWTCQGLGLTANGLLLRVVEYCELERMGSFCE